MKNTSSVLLLLSLELISILEDETRAEKCQEKMNSFLTTTFSGELQIGCEMEMLTTELQIYPSP